MKNLYITKTDETPSVYFNVNENIFEFSGKSLPENPHQFYAPIYSWIEEYIKNPNDFTHLVFKFEYLNTTSSKYLMKIFELFSLIDKSKSVKITWYYDFEDDDMKDAGKTFSSITKLNFEVSPVID